MIKDSQALDKIREAVGHYLRREISHGEAMEDVVTALEASGRDPFESVAASRIGRESRSWAPRRRASEGGCLDDAGVRRPELALRA
jgi:hypothetical protein